jgi:iron uptake system component EfeO
MLPESLVFARIATVFVFAISPAACSDDDADVGESASSGSEAGSGSGSGSASGLASQDLSGSTEDAVILSAVDEYRTYVHDEVSTLVDKTTVFTDAVRAGDIDAAKAAFAPSRFHWETIEPIAGLVEQIDGAVDARVDDFANETDPAWTGWHRIEYLLWEQGDVAAAVPFADQLDADLATLRDQLAGLELPPAAVALGAAELVEEVSEGKITGEEDRYSHTDLWDFAANIQGARKVNELLTPAVQQRDADLVVEIEDGFLRVENGLEPYRDGAGWKPYSELTDEDRAQIAAELADLAESLSTVPGTLGLS